MRFASVSVAYSGSVRFMVERRRRVKCDKCGALVDQVVDDYYTDDLTPGVDEPYDRLVVRQYPCPTPGCPGPDKE